MSSIPRVDLFIGARIGRWLITEGPIRNAKNILCWRCHCGNVRVIHATNIRSGTTKSCGCFKTECTKLRGTTHGGSVRAGSAKRRATRLYELWAAMKRRCNPNNKAKAEKYYNRGITICDEWRNSFESFRDWSLSHGYDDDLTLDREDNNGNYEPSNCRWTTLEVQANNTRNNVWIEILGERKTLAQWSKDPRCVTNYGNVQWRLKNGWPPLDAITKDSRRRPR